MKSGSSKRAERRHHAARMKRKAKRLLPHRDARKIADHMADCSCHMCGNPRRHWNEVTLQEKRQSLRMDDFNQGLYAA